MAKNRADLTLRNLPPMQKLKLRLQKQGAQIRQLRQDQQRLRQRLRALEEVSGT